MQMSFFIKITKNSHQPISLLEYYEDNTLIFSDK